VQIYLCCDVSDELAIFCLLPHLLPQSHHQLYCETTTISCGASKLETSNPCYLRDLLKQTFISRRRLPTFRNDLSQLARIPPTPSHFYIKPTTTSCGAVKLGTNIPGHPRNRLKQTNMSRKLPLTFRVELSKIDPVPPKPSQKFSKRMTD
jgi:hypothetical protein